MSPMPSICIIGAGATGLLLLLLLQEANIDPTRITIIDPYFDGGDLARLWTNVISNTPWSKTISSLQTFCPSLKIESTNALEKNTPLVEIAHFLRKAAAPILRRVTQIIGLVTSTNYDTSSRLWTITIHGQSKPILSDQCIFAQGAVPRTMNLPIPSIPLEVALDSRLTSYVKPGDKVIVFGTMHSGTLIIQNLASLSARVTAFYHSPQPFYWARDGAYKGIKADAADIADAIVAGKIPVTLVHIQNTEEVIRASRDADWVIYAMGFVPRDTIHVTVDGISRSSLAYDGQTGRFTEAPAWGFGIAYPSRAPDGVHWDVSVASFIEHMNSQISNIVNTG